MRLRKALLLLIIPINLFATPNTSTWQGTTNSMNTAGNWNPTGVPGGSDLELVFPASPTINTVTNDIGALSVDVMTFQDTYTMSSNPFVTTASGVVNVSSGTVTFNQSNQFSGVITIGSVSTPATLSAGIAGAIGSTSYQPTLNLLGNSIFNLNSNNNTLKSLEGNPGSTVSLGSAELTVTAGSEDLPFYGIISGTGTLVVPTGTLALMETNTYSGTTTIQTGGALNVLKGLGSTSQVNFPSGAGSLVFGDSLTSSKPMQVDGTASISVNDYNVNLTGSLTGSGPWSKLGRGTLTITNSSLSGPLTIAGGTLNGNATSLTAPAAITFDTFGGTLQIAGNMTLSQAITLANPGGFDTNSFNLELSGPISGSNPLTKTGAGTLTLTNTGNNYAAKTIIKQGTLSVTPQTFSSGSTQVVFNSPGSGILQITDGFPNFTPSIVFMADGTIDTNGNDMTVSGVVAGLSTNGFTKDGAGTLTFTGQNVYQGATNVSAGTLRAGIASTSTYGAFGINSPVTVSSGATANFQSFPTTVGSLDNSGTVLSTNTVTATSYTQGASATLGLDFPTNQATPVGNISTTAGINLDGTITVTNTGGFSPTSGTEVVLLQSSGTGKQVQGTFTTTNLPFGKLKYTKTQVILGNGGCDGIWTSTTNGNWGTMGNWSSSCVPGTTGNDQDSATFNDVAAANVIATLANDAGSTALPVTLHEIAFNSSSTNYTINQFDSNSLITLDAPAGSSNPSIVLTAGAATIDASIALNTDSVISLSSGTLTLGSNTAITSPSSNLQIIEGTQTGGVLTNNGSIKPDSLTIDGSTLNNSGTVQTTGSIIIEDLPGNVNPIVVNNSSTFTAGTTLSIGGNATVTNSSTMTSGGNFTISNGTVTNQSGAQLNAGPNSLLEVAGGSLTNDQGGMLGTSNSDLTVSGGMLTSSDQVLATNYTQNSSGTLELSFPTASASPVGNISTTAGINLAGTLNVTNTGGFSPTSGTEIILLQSSGTGKQVNGSFMPATLPFGKLKYTKTQVTLGVGGCDGIWTSTANGNWGTVGNWSSGCVPGIGGNDQDSATFNDVAAANITATLEDGSGALPITLHEIAFNSANTTYTINQFDSSSIITLDAPGGSSSPSIVLTAGAATIDAPIVLNTDSVISLSSGTLTLGPNTAITSTSSNLQIIEGTQTNGVLTNNGSIMPASLTIDGSTLNNSGTVQTTGSIIIEDLPGNVNPIIVNNSSTFTAGTTLSISGNATVTNSSTMTSGGNFTISSGTVNNQSGAQMNAGPSSQFSITGGMVTNSQGATLGSSDADLSLTGGTLNNSGVVAAQTYTQNSPGTLQLNLITNTNFGKVVASDQANIGGNLIVNASSDPSLATNQSFDLIVAQNGVSNTFSNVAFQGFPASIVPDLTYLTNAVQLNTSPAVPGHFSGNSHISIATIKQHNSYITRKCFQFRNRISNGSSSNNRNEIAQIDLSNPQVKGTVASLDDPSSVNTIDHEASNSNEKQLPAGSRQTRFGKVYIGPIASFGRVDSKGDQIGSTYTSVGGLLGADYLFRDIEHSPFDIGLGAIIQYRRQWGDGEKSSGNFQNHILHGSIYSSFFPQILPALSIEAILGYAHIWDHLNRRTGFDNKSTARSDTDQNLFDALLGLEYTFALPKQFSFTPYLYLQYIYNHISGFKESGAGIYNLKVNSQSTDSLNTQLGARTCYDLIRKSFTLTFEFDTEWIHEYLNNDRTVGFTPFVISTQPTNVTAFGASRNSLLLAADLLFRFVNGWQTEASYTFQYNSSFYDHFFYLGVGKRF
ncbi:autotransporter domain-containing protein [Simkania sp.]|uniref:autotransporter domain-containing protein n=1 Tax=Simkania sp. TaxID=34094 RepID=UPI003B52D3D0